MTPSEKAKSLGFKSLAELSKLSGESVQTLINWHRNYPQRFEFIAVGVMSCDSHVAHRYIERVRKAQIEAVTQYRKSGEPKCDFKEPTYFNCRCSKQQFKDE
jgi:hypothetical protein